MVSEKKKHRSRKGGKNSKSFARSLFDLSRESEKSQSPASRPGHQKKNRASEKSEIKDRSTKNQEKIKSVVDSGEKKRAHDISPKKGTIGKKAGVTSASSKKKNVKDAAIGKQISHGLDVDKKQKNHHSSSKKTPINLDDVISRYSFVIEEEPDTKPIDDHVPRVPATFSGFLLLNVEYDRNTNKALMRFYNPNDKKIYHMTDVTGHQSYCYHRKPKSELEKKRELLDVDGFDRIETVQKFDLLKNEMVSLSKIYGKTPLTIASGKNCVKSVLPGVLEANIRYHLNYIADLQLVPGLYYSFKDGQLQMDKIKLNPEVEKEIEQLMKEEDPEYRSFFKGYMELFNPPVPDFPRVAIDLEIFQDDPSQFPDPEFAKHPIIAASICASDGKNEVLVWKEHVFNEVGDESLEFPENIKVRLFKSEGQLVRALFRVLWDYPIVITFNGDEFDFRYLVTRSKILNIPENENPIVMARGIGISKNSAFLKKGLHVDLFQFFRNRSIQGYGFSGVYTEFSLDAISRALLGVEKFQHEKDISEMAFLNLVYYNWKDAYLTLELTRFRSNLTMILIVLLMRITRLPMNEIVRTWVSSWIKQLLIWEHRKRNYLIPNQEDLKNRAGPSRDLKGAIVIKPKPGIYFDVIVMDFSSLYPSIIKEYNLSYETINCNCKNCKKTPVANTNYHVCWHRIGIMSLVTGVIRDLRVLYFKPKSKDKTLPDSQKAFFITLQSALKVLINASYGVYGSETFSLYCLPVAESTTAIGRYSIMQTVKKSEELGIVVLYGDSDSVFLINPGKEKIQALSNWSEKTLKLELEVDKSYRFLALSRRKKNYLGVYTGGGVDIKGLVGKKSNTAMFIREAFFEFTNLIKEIKTESDFKRKKESIFKLIRAYWNKIKKGALPLECYEIKVSLRGKTVNQINSSKEPSIKIQHVMAARELIKLGIRSKFDSGDVFSYVKVKSGAKAIELAKVEEIDKKKYQELFRSTFEQVLDALGISFDEIIGIRKLDSFY
ncbi:MAG: DNA-directed DNA polymerase I [Promethearchaeota archaeon]